MIKARLIAQVADVTGPRATKKEWQSSAEELCP